MVSFPQHLLSMTINTDFTKKWICATFYKLTSLFIFEENIYFFGHSFMMHFLFIHLTCFSRLWNKQIPYVINSFPLHRWSIHVCFYAFGVFFMSLTWNYQLPLIAVIPRQSLLLFHRHWSLDVSLLDLYIIIIASLVLSRLLHRALCYFTSNNNNTVWSNFSSACQFLQLNEGLSEKLLCCMFGSQ